MTARRNSRGSSPYSGWQSRYSRRSDADHDHAYEVRKQKALEEAARAAEQPAANDDQTEEKQNG